MNTLFEPGLNYPGPSACQFAVDPPVGGGHPRDEDEVLPNTT